MPTRPPQHQPASAPKPGAYDRQRGCAAARGYDDRWRKFRAFVLAGHPLCADCLKQRRAVPATDVHHIARLADAPQLRLDPGNVMALCKACHSVRTALGE